MGGARPKSISVTPTRSDICGARTGGVNYFFDSSRAITSYFVAKIRGAKQRRVDKALRRRYNHKNNPQKFGVFAAI